MKMLSDLRTQAASGVAEPDMAQWILGRQMAAAINCLNAPFCTDGGGVTPSDNPGYVMTLAQAIKDAGTSEMAVEDALDVLTEVLRLIRLK